MNSNDKQTYRLDVRMDNAIVVEVCKALGNPSNLLIKLVTDNYTHRVRTNRMRSQPSLFLT